VVLTNSDSTVIRLMLRWFRECFGVGEERFQPRVFISDVHRDREEVLIEFWSRTLKLPREQFRKTVFLDKGRKIYENRDTYYGVLALRVAKSTDIRYRILAQIARVADLLPG